MSRYIDIDKAIPIVIGAVADITGGITQIDAVNIVDKLEEIPIENVVEVVRCKDCKHLYCLSAIDRRFYCRHYPQGLSGINIIEDNPYCSYGERKKENEG